jgi:hypothetical protein
MRQKTAARRGHPDSNSSYFSTLTSTLRQPRHRSTLPATAPSLPRRGALRAGTNFPQIEPRINSQIVPIVPRKLQRILAHCLGRERFHGRLEHRQSPRRQLRRFARFSSRLSPLIFAKRARTRVPQERKRVDGPVPILPLDLHSRTRRQMDQYRLRIVPHPGRVIRQRHKFQYRTCTKLLFSVTSSRTMT